MTTIDKIRAEIERCKAQYQNWQDEGWNDDMHYGHGRFDSYIHILFFLDSLEEKSEIPTNLPSNLDEAAETYYDEMWDEFGGVAMVRNNEHDIWYPSSVIETVFKAGAKWMAGQGVKATASVGYYNQSGLSFLTEPSIHKLGFEEGDEVEMFLRKK